MTCAAGSAQDRGDAGFTLLELMAALAIAGLLAWVALPAFGRRPAPTPELLARDLQAALRDTRTQALATGRTAAFVLDLAHRRYAGAGDRPRALPADATVNLHTDAALVAGGIGRIAFYPDGGASGGSLRVERGGRAATVTVDWLTGAVRRGP